MMPSMTDSSDPPRVRLTVEIECAAIDEASTAITFTRFRRELKILYPGDLVRMRRQDLPPAERDVKSLPPGAVIHRIDDQRHGGKQRGFRTITIPACAWFACECGHIWAGPVDTAVDPAGYLWNCPGCIERLEANAAPQTPPNDKTDPPA